MRISANVLPISLATYRLDKQWFKCWPVSRGQLGLLLILQQSLELVRVPKKAKKFVYVAWLLKSGKLLSFCWGELKNMPPWDLSCIGNGSVLEGISDNEDLPFWNARREWICRDFLNLSLGGSLHSFLLQGRDCSEIALVWYYLLDSSFLQHFQNFLFH